MITVLRVYLPNGQSVLYKEGKNRVVGIEENTRGVIVFFKDGSERTYCGMQYVLEVKCP